MRKWHSRYGEFKASDHILPLIGLTVMLAGSIYGILRMDISSLLATGCFLIALFFLWMIFFPYFEKFSIEEGQIKTVKLWQKCDIEMPESVILIVSPAHVAPLDSIQSVKLKNALALSIVLPENPEQLLETLRGKDQYGCYTNLTVERRLEWKCLYHFVMDEDLFAQTLSSCNVEKIILPASLSSKIHTKDLCCDVWIDEKC